MYDPALGLRCECILIIPIRMTEAYLLISEDTIRNAAENKHGTIPLKIPGLSLLECLPNPKEVLNDLLRAASEKSGRRLKECSGWRQQAN